MSQIYIKLPDVGRRTLDIRAPYIMRSTIVNLRLARIYLLPKKRNYFEEDEIVSLNISPILSVNA
jgi:hypothetical protein